MGKTLFEISSETGAKIPTLQKRLQRAGLGCPAASVELSANQLSALTEKTKTRKKSMPFRMSATIEKTTDNGQNKERTTDKKEGSVATDKTKDTKRIMALCLNGAITAVSVALTSVGLYQLCGVPGILLAVMVSFYFWFSVWVACDNMKGDTSQSALDRLLYLELALVALHSYTFYNVLPKEWPFWCMVTVSIGLSLIVPFVSYTAVQMLRSWHAEV